MRLPCPICGERDHREFYYQGAAEMLYRPELDASVEVWNDHLHARPNVPGPHDELWSHDAGCGAWLKVTRNTVTHEVLGSVLASEVKR